MTDPVCPTPGAPMHRNTRPVTLIYKCETITFAMPGWYCAASGESTHSGQDMKVSDRMVNRLKAQAEPHAGPPMIESSKPPKPNLYERIRALVEPLGGADDLELSPREPGRDPPDFDTADYDLPPDWPQKSCAGARRRGPGAVPADAINAEIDAVGADAPARREEDDA